MKRMTPIFLAALFGMVATAGELNWYTNMADAKAAAKAEGKTILVNFTGSDWCGWCKKLDREVFSQASFESFAQEKLILLKLDFPKYKDQPKEVRDTNRALMNKYGVRGFPTILLVNAEEKLVFETGYQPGGADSYIAHLASYVNK